MKSLIPNVTERTFEQMFTAIHQACDQWRDDIKSGIVVSESINSFWKPVIEHIPTVFTSSHQEMLHHITDLMAQENCDTSEEEEDES